MPPLMKINDRLRSTKPGSCMIMLVNSALNRLLSVLGDGESSEADGDAAVILPNEDELS